MRQLIKDWCAQSWIMEVRFETPRYSSSGRIRKRAKARSQVRDR